MLRVGKDFTPFPPSHSVQDLARQHEHSDLLFGKKIEGHVGNPYERVLAGYLAAGQMG